MVGLLKPFLCLIRSFYWNGLLMLLSPDLMRMLLLMSLLGMAILAALFLRRRNLPFPAYLRWGLLIILVPLLGPFLVILSSPGKRLD